MKQWLYEVAFVTAATWAIDASVDHWMFGHHHSAYHISSLVSGLAVGAMFFLWRYRERQYHREMHAFELQRRARQHTISNKLQVIAGRGGHDPQIQAAARDIAKMLAEPIVSRHCAPGEPCVCEFLRRSSCDASGASTGNASAISSRA
jgi:hypothetical protein